MTNIHPDERRGSILPWWNRMTLWLRRVRDAVRPGPRAWHGAALGMIPIAVIFISWYSVEFFGISGPVQLVAGFLFLVAAAALAGGAVIAAVRLLGLFPRLYGWLGSVTLILVFYSLVESQTAAAMVVTLVLAAVGSMLGASLWILVRTGGKDLTRLQRTICWGGLGAGLAGMVFCGWLFLSDGYPVKPPENAAALSRASITPLDVPDPSNPGSYAVRTITYGSGSDRHRPEFARDADIVTTRVDGSRLIETWSALRTGYWGFDSRTIPRNARVWYPAGNGPFPLVLMVHGNHFMEDYSDVGYAYLGTLLASRGFIVASVDQNFLNSSAFADFFVIGGVPEENDARGWLLLEHLNLWRDWNSDPGSLFYHKVDMDRIALIGHSCGGEAVAVAAAFNQLSSYPEDASLAFHYGFNIRTLIALAPVDGQYMPGDRILPLENVNYLVLQGAQDMDVSDFMGARTFERIQFTDGQPRFKAAVYIYGANHGQFNTSWGRKDLLPPGVSLFNLKPLMPAGDQEQIAKVYISSMLEATLHQEEDYLPLFQDYRAAPSSWLPETIYLSQYQDSSTLIVSTFDEDIDPGTTTLSGGIQSGANLTLWQERLVGSKWGNLGTSAVYLGWNTDSSREPASYTITLPPDLNLDGKKVLTFSMADANPVPGGSAANDPEGRVPVDLTVELIDRTGNRARLSLSHDSLLQMQIGDQTAKLPFLAAGPASQAVYRTFHFLLADFTASSPDIDLANLREIRFVFDRTRSGEVVLDNFGFR